MNPENSNPTRRSRNPSCTLCGNHGVRSELKNHKHKCPYNTCACKLCERGRERREVMRKQVRLRRQQMKQIYSKGGSKNKRGNYALGLDNNPPKTIANSLAASSNIDIVSGKLNIPSEKMTNRYISKLTIAVWSWCLIILFVRYIVNLAKSIWFWVTRNNIFLREWSWWKVVVVKQLSDSIIRVNVSRSFLDNYLDLASFLP